MRYTNTRLLYFTYLLTYLPAAVAAAVVAAATAAAAAATATATTTTTNVMNYSAAITQLRGHVTKSRYKTVAQLNADVDHRSRRRHVSRMTDEKGETWSPSGMSKVRSRPARSRLFADDR